VLETRENKPNKREAKVEIRQIAQFKEREGKTSGDNAMPCEAIDIRPEKSRTQDLEIETWAWESIYL